MTDSQQVYDPSPLDPEPLASIHGWGESSTEVRVTQAIVRAGIVAGNGSIARLRATERGDWREVHRGVSLRISVAFVARKM